MATADPDDLQRRWNGRLAPVMRQHHIAGERVFIDYAGTTLAVIDAGTGEVSRAQLFVATLGALSLTCAEASWSQSHFGLDLCALPCLRLLRRRPGAGGMRLNRPGFTGG